MLPGPTIAALTVIHTYPELNQLRLLVAGRIHVVDAPRIGGKKRESVRW